MCARVCVCASVCRCFLIIYALMGTGCLDERHIEYCVTNKTAVTDYCGSVLSFPGFMETANRMTLLDYKCRPLAPEPLGQNGMMMICHDMFNLNLTLSQWSSSGNPVCLKLRPQCTLECHWRKPVCFQWSSSGCPVVFQCVPFMQINTGSPLEHHWVLASAIVAPVASQCTCGSSGLPVCSNYAN